LSSKREIYRKIKTGSNFSYANQYKDINETEILPTASSVAPNSRAGSYISKRRALVEKKSLTIDEAFDRAGGFGKNILFIIF